MRTLYVGCVGSDVESLQRSLNSVGWKPSLDEDGDFGGKTYAATVWFQSAHVGPGGEELAPDGVVGPKTWWALSNRGSNDTSDPIPPPIHPPTPSSTPTISERIVQIGRLYHSNDVRERPLGSNRGGPAVGAQDRFSVDAIQKPFFQDAGRPWCAMTQWQFVTQSGLLLPTDGFASVSSWWEAAGDHAHGMDLFAARDFIPMAGDLFLVGNSTHMGLVEQNLGNGSISTIEGNSSDRLRSLERKIAGVVTFYIRLPDA